MTVKLISKVSSVKSSSYVSVAGDKSISHRSLLLASQTMGLTEITGLLEAEDVKCTIAALRSLGVELNKHKSGNWRVNGKGIGSLKQPKLVVDMGNSGTGVRLLMGMVASQPISVAFTGDESLRKRPMNRVIKPLMEIGAEFESQEGGLLPVTVNGVNDAMPISYEMPVASAQVKSAILLAALNIAGETSVIEKQRTRDHSEIMLKYLGFDIKIEQDEQQRRVIKITGEKQVKARDLSVPGDPSSAAFIVVSALIAAQDGAEIIIENICVNPLRTGLFGVLQQMGAKLEYVNQREVCGEQIADLKVQKSDLQGVDIPAEIAPSMIDEYPILAIAASVAKGTTRMRGLHELRVKESDRLQAMCDGLRLCGVKAEIENDDLIVEGGDVKGNALIPTYDDHRIAMSFLILGMVAEQPITIDDGEMIKTSFPNFVELMNNLGAKISEL
jgi:3-phosphoshikimate 1-carboxyvinyltransferase